MNSESGFPEDREGSPTPYWLESVVGSLAEERRKSSSKSFRNYNRLVLKARNQFRSEFSVHKLKLHPENFYIKLSDLEALYPSLTYQLEFNLQELTQSKQRLLRSFLFYFYSNDFPEWFIFLVEEELDKLLPVGKVANGGKVFKENLIIRQTFLLLGRQSGLQLLSEVYSEENIERWKHTGECLCTHYSLVKLPKANLKDKVRRRGYKETSSNKHKQKSMEGVVNMSTEARDLEEVKRRIKLKQAELFEKRLDRYLEIESELSSQKRKEIFYSLLEEEDQIAPSDLPTLEKLQKEREENRIE